MRLEFIPAIILGLLAIQYFLTKRRATVAGKTAPKKEALVEETTTDPAKKSVTIKKVIEKFAKNEERFWLLGFIVTAVITILLYTVLKDPGHERWESVGLITLVGMHVFIFWNFFQALRDEGKLHPATKFFVGVCLIFWSIALFVPNFAEWTVTEAKSAVNTFDGRFNKDSAREGVGQQSAPTNGNAGALVTSQILQAIPGERFKKVSIPPGRIIKDLTWDCPDGCILEIVHDGQPLCTATNIYQGLPCGSLQPETENGGTTRNREQFAMPYGKFINFPRNLVLISVSFGTDENLGPIEVTATVSI